MCFFNHVSHVNNKFNDLFLWYAPFTYETLALLVLIELGNHTIPYTINRLLTKWFMFAETQQVTVFFLKFYSPLFS